MQKHVKRFKWRAEVPFDMCSSAHMLRLLDEPLPRPLPHPFELLFMDRRKLVKLPPYTSLDHDGPPEECLLTCNLCEQEKEHPEWLPYTYPPDFYDPDAFSVTWEHNFFRIGVYANGPEEWVMKNGPTGEGQIPGIDSWADCEREIIAIIDRLPNLEAFVWEMEIALPSKPIVDALVREPKSLRMFHAPGVNPRSDVMETLPVLAGVECLSLEFDNVEGDEELLTKVAIQLFNALCTSGKVKHLKIKIRNVDKAGYGSLIALAARLNSFEGMILPRRDSETDKPLWSPVFQARSQVADALNALRPLLRQAWLGKDGSGDLTGDDVAQVFKKHDVLHPLGHLVDINTDSALAQKTADVWNAQTDKGSKEPGWPREAVLSLEHGWPNFPPFAPEP
ncbi:hypothetical protein FA10DRAFT_270099 [Acaromyces ingoldii]|uniref:Uncharacterized protein n=1 Tax=Acaromyces ingoldii TaxID=215250 RepID=A0A316YFK8_9BASI|nr:hypothetical protein FA10DRAFT_270099 [Acaromyces ingoldii]PWN86535.1 hypothetical protein FA10DRAFT_270099 [Acaromyces ingoldii]